MLVEIDLKRSSFFDVVENIEFYVYGFISIGDKVAYDKNFVDILDEAYKMNDLAQLTKKSGGNFGFVIYDRINSLIILTSDLIRSYPIFYSNNKGNVRITDCLPIDNDYAVSEILLENFLISGFVFSNKTIYQNIFQIEAGQIIEISYSNISTNNYFVYNENQLFCNDKLSFEKLDIIFKNTIVNMIKSADHVNNWIVPLSGGHDSRLIVNYLKKLGVSNVICYSYGITCNKESAISEKVANALGYKWVFIESTDDLWSEIRSLGILDEFCDYSFNGVSVPCIQDLFAVYSLKTGIINDRDIFIPGYLLDFLTGEHWVPGMKKINSYKNALPYINRFYGHWSYVKRNRRFQNYVRKYLIGIGSLPAKVPLRVNWQERQSKFIVNSVRVYEYFGFKWRIPFWDLNIVDFWKNVDPILKQNRLLFYEFENEFLLETLKNIPFANTAKVQPSKIRKLYSFIYNSFPNIVRMSLKKISKKKETIISEGLHFSYPDSTIKIYFTNLDKLPKKLRLYLKPYLFVNCRNSNFHQLTILNVLNMMFVQSKHFNE